MNNIKLGPGTLYFSGPNGEAFEAGSLSSLPELEPDFIDEEAPVLTSIGQLSATFSAVARISQDALAAITGVTKAVMDMARRGGGGRVVHLALHARKKRTRKKNLHRAFRTIEKEANE